MHLIYRTNCRVCNSSHLTKVIDLGEQHLQNTFFKPGKNSPPKRKIPTLIVRCDPTKDEKACGLLQLAHTVPPNILYSEYWYRSSTNDTMKSHLREIAQEATKMILKKRAFVLDIGCNDGTLLSYYPKGFLKFGIDPSNAVEKIKLKAKIVRDIFPSVELDKMVGNKKFDIITSIAMFYDLDDPISFTNKIKEFLSPNGIWIFEMYYMPNMLQENCYDTICHEHLEYYSLSVIERILKMSGLKILKASLNNINGGSIRCYAVHEDNTNFKKYEYLDTVNRLRKDEFDLELDTDKPYRKFQEKIEEHKDKLSQLLRNLKREGKIVHIYGASTKGNTILQFCNLDNSIIDYAADRNPEKYGAFTPGTNIPIISEEKSRGMKPDYYLVLPWSFKKEFIKREKQILKSGTKFIFPFPNIEIIEK